MRNLFLLLVIASTGILVSCSKNSGSPAGSINDPVDTASLQEIYNGSFINGPYGTVDGVVRILSDSANYQLLLDDFTTSNGPDLHVYLSQEVQPIHFIDLGKLKSVSGNQVYNITGKPNFALYKYALIHCQLYNHLFGSSELK